MNQIWCHVVISVVYLHLRQIGDLCLQTVCRFRFNYKNYFFHIINRFQNGKML